MKFARPLIELAMISFQPFGFDEYAFLMKAITVKTITRNNARTIIEMITIDGTYVNPTRPLATVENVAAPGRIRILKQDALDQHAIEGVQFDIYTVDANGEPDVKRKCRKTTFCALKMLDKGSCFIL